MKRKKISLNILAGFPEKQTKRPVCSIWSAAHLSELDFNLKKSEFYTNRHVCK